jgi:hypothetical protein
MHAARLAEVTRQFADPSEFASSPLYRQLSNTVAAHPDLIRLAARGRPGQHPPMLYLGAVHALLLRGVQHELATFYPSIVGRAARPPASAGTALVHFCTLHHDAIAAIIETRLVQTNLVKRALAFRLGLAEIGRRISAPVHLIEVGASAGLLLRFDRYGYALGGRQFGAHTSPVQLTAEWRSASPVPDLDAVPALASVTGIDLHPLNAASAADRQWLEALVWPENRFEAELLHAALGLVAADPPIIHAGDAVDICPTLAAEVPRGEPRVVFHAMTRMHVPEHRRASSMRPSTRLGGTARASGCPSKARASLICGIRMARYDTWRVSAGASNGSSRARGSAAHESRLLGPQSLRGAGIPHPDQH